MTANAPRIAGGLLLLVVGLVIMAWLIARPSGQLRLAAFPAVADDATKLQLATKLFQLADAALSDAEEHHRQLSFAVEADVYDASVSIPPPAGPGQTGLKRFVPEAEFDATIEQAPATVSISVDGLAIIEESYELFGLHDYFVVIREIEPCRPDTQKNCWRIVAQYWPSRMRPDVFIGTEDELARDLAVLVLRGAVQNQGDEWRRTAAAKVGEAPPFLMAAAIPTSMAALEATARGLQILTLGREHPQCRSQTETKVECILLALAAFQQSDELEQTLNPVAAFGHALIELDAAFSAARKLEWELTVENHLRHAEGWTSLARQSEFLRSAMDRADLGSGFKLLELHGITPGDDLIHLSRRFACALANYRRANWRDCVSEINDRNGVLDFPPPLQPYVEAALTDASLSEANADRFGGQFKVLMQRLSSSGDGNAEPSYYQLRRVVLKHACEREDALDDDSFAALVRATTDNAPNQSAHQEAIVLATACRQGQRFPSEADLKPIIDSVEAMQDGEERHRFELLLAQYRIRQGRLDAALDLARRALALPWTRPYVLKAPEFAAMINSPVYGPEFVKASFATTTLSELESCPRLE